MLKSTQLINVPLLSLTWGSATSPIFIISIHHGEIKSVRAMTRLREMIQLSVEFLRLWPGQMMPERVAALGMFLADPQQHQIANETEVRAVTVCRKKIVQFSFDWSQPVPEKPKPRVCRGVCINLWILFFGLWRDTTMLSSSGKLKGKKNPCKFYFNQSADSTSLCSNLSYIFLHQPVISYISQTDLWHPVENRHKVRETLWNCGC